MARDPGSDDVIVIDHDENKIKAVLNDVAYVVVSATGSILSYPVLSASTARVASLDPAFRVVLADATAANFGIVLPSAASNPGKQITVKKIDLGANSVFLSGAGSEKVDGSAFYTIKSANAAVTVLSDGVDWKVIAIASASIAATV